MSYAIKIENLSKRYSINHSHAASGSLKDAVGSLLQYITPKRFSVAQPQLPAEPEQEPTEEFWALRDVSFDIEPGERLGVMGRNGAGKSTLLKILSRITEPTSGRVVVRGHMSSLLEVGTGFHPDLSGRENVFLNGAILGMSRAEIQRKFDEIVAFSEIEKFIDTPVKHYSSGMQVRLAFAVAAHLEPEILILDEVLAVGDAAFQKKCLGKMDEISKGGSTVIFVSHGVGAIQQYCNRAVVLEQGRLILDTTDVRKAVQLYAGESDTVRTSVWRNSGAEYENPWFMPISLEVTDSTGKPLNVPMKNTDEVWVRIEGEVRDPDPLLTIGYVLYNSDGAQIYWSYPTDIADAQWPQLKKGNIVMRSQIPRRLLNEGDYRVALLGGLHCKQWLFQPERKAPIVNLSISGGLSDSSYWRAARPPLLAPVLNWEIEQ